MSHAITVLVADDSTAERDRTAELLEKWGYRVVTASDGAAAIRRFHEDPTVRLAVLDWEMPILDGLKVVRQIKNGGRFVFVLMVTAKEGDRDLSQAFDAGVDDFLAKPVRAFELRARLGAGARLGEAQMHLTQTQKLESVGRLAAGVAHEINTPAQYVGDNLSFLQTACADLISLFEPYRALLAAARAQGLLADEVAAISKREDEIDASFLEEEIQSALAQSREGVERVAEIVRAMKDFAHPGSTEKEPTDVNAMVSSTVTVAASELKYVADVALDLDEALPLVPCLSGELKQALLNLVVNAAHAMAEGSGDDRGTLTIRTRRAAREERDGVAIEIHDTGPGIPEEIRDRIFDPFFTTKEVGKGTGQGLAIARTAIVAKHEGRIDVRSAPGEGTSFTLWLPLDEASTARSDTGSSNRPAA